MQFDNHFYIINLYFYDETYTQLFQMIVQSGGSLLGTSSSSLIKSSFYMLPCRTDLLDNSFTVSKFIACHMSFHWLSQLREMTMVLQKGYLFIW